VPSNVGWRTAATRRALKVGSITEIINEPTAPANKDA